MDTFMVYVTAKDEEEAEKISHHLLKMRLIACSNLFPIKSLYWWEGKIENEPEIALIMKTQKIHKDRIIQEITKIHSYDVPCIEFLPIESQNPVYLEWIIKETSG